MDDLIRELEKALDVLRSCRRHFDAAAEANAALHMAEVVRPNPLAAAVALAAENVERVLKGFPRAVER